MWEKDSTKVCEEVFRDLASRISKTKYNIQDEERDAFSECTADIGSRLLTRGGGLGIAGYSLARAITSGPMPVSMRRSGRLLCFLAGTYIGGRIAMRGMREQCLGHVLDLQTPLGAEAEVLLREKAPDSPLLSRRPAPDIGAEGRPRLADAAALQHAVHQAHQAAGVEDSTQAELGSGSWEARPSPQRSRPPPPWQSPDQPQPQLSPEQQLEQPDAFGSLGGDAFSSGGGNSSEHDSWGRKHADKPTGLETVSRHKRRTERTFDDTDLGNSSSNRWGSNGDGR